MKKKYMVLIVIGILLFLICVILKKNTPEKVIANFFEEITMLSQKEYDTLSGIINDTNNSEHDNIDTMVSEKVQDWIYRRFENYLTEDAVKSVINSGLLTIGFYPYRNDTALLEIETLDISKKIDSTNDLFYYEYKIVWLLDGEKISNAGNIYVTTGLLPKIDKLVSMD